MAQGLLIPLATTGLIHSAVGPIREMLSGFTLSGGGRGGLSLGQLALAVLGLHHLPRCSVSQIALLGLSKNLIFIQVCSRLTPT